MFSSGPTFERVLDSLRQRIGQARGSEGGGMSEGPGDLSRDVCGETPS